MAKDYLCKDCQFNNNGWCKKRKIQKLKDISECNFYNGDEEEVLSFYEKLKEDGKLEPCKNYGKREMFSTMCQQIRGMEREGKRFISIKELKALMINLEQGLLINEELCGISLDWEVDKDIYNSSKNLIQYWKKNL